MSELFPDEDFAIVFKRDVWKHLRIAERFITK